MTVRYSEWQVQKQMSGQDDEKPAPKLRCGLGAEDGLGFKVGTDGNPCMPFPINAAN